MNIREMRHKINTLLTEAQTIALAGFTSESRAKFDKITNDVQAIEAAISIEERLAEGRSFKRSEGRGSFSGNGAYEAQQDRRALSAAWRSFARHGLNSMSEEHRSLLTTSDATGGALIPQLFEGVLHEALRFYGPIADKVAQKRTESGAPMKISLTDDTENGLSLLATEGTSSPAETDPTFQSKLLGVDTVTGGLVLVSFDELEDSAFDLDSWLRRAFSRRYARGLSKAIVLGTDVNGTALPNFTSILSVASAVNSVTTTLAGGIGWDDLTNLIAAIDPAYAGENASWTMNAATRNYLLGQKDVFGKPYYTPDPSQDKPFQKILGYDIVLDQNMPAYGTASATPILFGSLTDAYLLRTVAEGASILRLNERYADTLQVGFFLYARVGGTSLVKTSAPAPLVKLVQPAS